MNNHKSVVISPVGCSPSRIPAVIRLHLRKAPADRVSGGHGGEGEGGKKKGKKKKENEGERVKREKESISEEDPVSPVG